MMKVSNYSKKGDNIVEFDISGVNVSMLNAFRRTIVATVPVMAVEKITFYYNSSIMNDESLAHRIGLIPLTTDLKTYTLPTECNCKGEGCARCMCKLTLEVKGPKTVYSGDMKSTDENVKPVFDKIPIIKILKDQEVKLEADAILGLGREHVKWQAGQVAYEITDKNSFHVMVESYGSLPVEELIKTAFEVVEKKITQLKEKVA
jgi:DNA-directed RNA polymerase subunit D